MILLATQDDVRKRLGRDLTAAELEKLPGLLEEASVLVASLIDAREITPPAVIPDRVVLVASRMVARALPVTEEDERTESTQMSAGSFQMTRNYAARGEGGGVWLTRADRRLLTGSAVSVPLKSERC